MTTANFNAILSKQVEEVERPKPLPVGTYLFNIVRHEFGESQQKKTPYVRFICKPMMAQDDVDKSMLPENWQSKEFRQDFYLTDEAMFRLRDFLETIQVSVSGRTFAAAIPDTTNRQFLGTVTHTIGKDGKSVYAEIGNVAAA